MNSMSNVRGVGVRRWEVGDVATWPEHVTARSYYRDYICSFGFLCSEASIKLFEELEMCLISALDRLNDLTSQDYCPLHQKCLLLQGQKLTASKSFKFRT